MYLNPYSIPFRIWIRINFFNPTVPGGIIFSHSHPMAHDYWKGGLTWGGCRASFRLIVTPSWCLHICCPFHSQLTIISALSFFLNISNKCHTGANYCTLIDNWLIVVYYSVAFYRLVSSFVLQCLKLNE